MSTTEPIKASNEGLQGEAIKRTLHFYWLIDISASMSGWKIQTVNDSIKNVLGPIRDATKGQAKVMMRVITFGTSASWKVGPDPVPIENFTWIDLDAPDSSTSTAKGIELLCNELDLEKLGRRNVPPVAILMSDGHCTDSDSAYKAAIERLNNLPWGKKAARISIGIGNDGEYDKDKLDEFISPYLRKNDNISTFNASDASKLARYIKLLSVEVSKSASVKEGDVNKDDGKAPLSLKVDENDVF